MRVLVIAVGSRGDTEPYCSLAASLAEQDEVDAVEMFLQKDAMHLVPKCKEGDITYDKIQTHELPFTQMDFYKYAGKRSPPQPGAGHPNPRVQFIGIVTDIMGEMVLPCLDHVLDVATGKSSSGKQVDAIVASSLAREIGMVVASQLPTKTPLYLVQLQSLVPTKDFPHYSQLEESLKAVLGQPGPSEEYFQGYIELERFQWDFLQVHIDKLCQENENSNVTFDFEKDMVPALMGQQTSHGKLDVWMVNAVSTPLVPAASDAGDRVLNVGNLADTYVPPDFSPPDDLVQFLKRHDNNNRPICFGYGSMPFGQAELLLEALQQVQRPAVLVGSAMTSVLTAKKEALSEWTKIHVFAVDSIPYAWLLPQCCMMFCHGGAGVVHTALRAGIPPVVSPLMGDQFFFAKLLSAKTLGVQASSNLGSLTKEDVLSSISKADACWDACQQFRIRMGEADPGVKGLVKAILSPNAE